MGIVLVFRSAGAEDTKTKLTQNDFKNLHIFMDAASGVTGKLPDKATTVAALKMEKGAANLVKAIEDGSLILTGATSREDVWAYEKNAPDKRRLRPDQQRRRQARCGSGQETNRQVNSSPSFEFRVPSFANWHNSELGTRNSELGIRG